MILKFKVTTNAPTDQWIGWFGEDVIKLRLASKQDDMPGALIKFISENMGIRETDIKVIPLSNSPLVQIEFPDRAWELFLSIIEK